MYIGDIEDLKLRIKTRDPACFGELMRAVEDMGEQAGTLLSELVECLEDGNGEMRAQALNTIGYLGEVACLATPAVLRRLDDLERPVRNSSARVLGEIGAVGHELGGRVVEDLFEWVQGADATGLAHAIRTLGLMAPRDPRLPPLLVRALEGDEMYPLVEAQAVLVKHYLELDDPFLQEWLAGLRRALQLDSVRERALARLADLGPVASACAHDVMEVVIGPNGVRVSALAALVAIGPPPEATQLMVQSARSANQAIRILGIRGVSAGINAENAHRAVVFLASCLAHDDTRTVWAVAEALASAGPPAAVAGSAIRSAIARLQPAVDPVSEYAIAALEQALMSSSVQAD